MSEEGQRIEFGDAGPYLITGLEMEPQAMLLEEHDVCLFQFKELYFPVSLEAAPAIASALSNMSQAAMGPEREGMVPLDLDMDAATEMPLITGCAEESFQHNEVIYMDVFFGETSARLCFSIMAAAIVGQVLSQIPTK